MKIVLDFENNDFHVIDDNGQVSNPQNRVLKNCTVDGNVIEGEPLDGSREDHSRFLRTWSTHKPDLPESAEYFSVQKNVDGTIGWFTYSTKAPQS